MKGYVKVRILLEHGVQMASGHLLKTESLWAKPVGTDLFELSNIPAFCYGVNYKDIVHAIYKEGELCVTKVVTPSGHQTLRALFNDQQTEDAQLARIEVLEQSGAEVCISFGMHLINIPPATEINSVISILDNWESLGICSYETTETRIEGSFDDYPSEPSEDEQMH